MRPDACMTVAVKAPRPRFGPQGTNAIERHNPTLALSLTGMDNAFKPWGLNMPAEYESWSAGAKADHFWVNGARAGRSET